MARKSLKLFLLLLGSLSAATLTGRITLQGQPLPRFPVTIVGMPSGYRKTVTSDANGRYLFHLPQKPQKLYLLKAVYRKVPFYAGPVQNGSEGENWRKDLSILPVLSTKVPALLTSDVLLIQFAKGITAVDRELTFTNPHPFVILPSPPLSFPLGSFKRLQVQPNLQQTCCVKHKKNHLLITRPLYPGENRVRFQYQVSRSSEKLSFSTRLQFPTEQLALLVPYTPLPLNWKGFDTKEVIELQGDRLYLLKKNKPKIGETFTLSIPTTPLHSWVRWLPLVLLAPLFFSLFRRLKPKASEDPLDQLARAALVREIQKKEIG